MKTKQIYEPWHMWLSIFLFLGCSRFVVISFKDFYLLWLGGQMGTDIFIGIFFLTFLSTFFFFGICYLFKQKQNLWWKLLLIGMLAVVVCLMLFGLQGFYSLWLAENTQTIEETAEKVFVDLFLISFSPFCTSYLLKEVIQQIRLRRECKGPLKRIRI